MCLFELRRACISFDAVARSTLLFSFFLCLAYCIRDAFTNAIVCNLWNAFTTFMLSLCGLYYLRYFIFDAVRLPMPLARSARGLI